MGKFITQLTKDMISMMSKPNYKKLKAAQASKRSLSEETESEHQSLLDAFFCQKKNPSSQMNLSALKIYNSNNLTIYMAERIRFELITEVPKTSVFPLHHPPRKS